MPTPWAPAWRASLVLSLALTVAPPARALQLVEAGEGETVLARIAARELTRIAVDRGRVRTVTALEGQLLVEKDDHTGAIFVRPTDPARAVNVFVGTDAGRTYALLLQPVDMPSDTILLRERTVRGAPGASALERAGAHETLVKRLIVALASGTVPSDLELREAGREIGLWREARFLHERSLLGRRVVGERYRLVNASGSVMRLAEAELYRDGVHAVAIEQRTLAPGESTPVYIVRTRGEAE